MDHQKFIQLLDLFEQNEEILISDAVDRLGITEQALISRIDYLNNIDRLLGYSDDDKVYLLKALDVFRPKHVQDCLLPNVRERIAQVDYFVSLSSTNDHAKKEDFQTSKALLCLAEHQSGGRGRRGKRWVSPFAKNIYLSLAYRCHIPMQQLGLVSLVVGLALADAVSQMGVSGVRVKWPNDIYFDDHKLAGILIETKNVTPHYADLIIGVGLNVYMDEEEAQDIEQAWVALNNITTVTSRSQLVAQLLNMLIPYLQQFEDHAFQSFEHKWAIYDYLYGQKVHVHGINNVLEGVASGVNEKGELLLLVGENLLAVNAGEVSVCLSQGET